VLPYCPDLPNRLDKNPAYLALLCFVFLVTVTVILWANKYEYNHDDGGGDYTIRHDTMTNI